MASRSGRAWALTGIILIGIAFLVGVLAAVAELRKPEATAAQGLGRLLAVSPGAAVPARPQAGEAQGQEKPL